MGRPELTLVKQATLKQPGRDAFPEDLVDDMVTLSRRHRPDLWDDDQIERALAAQTPTKLAVVKGLEAHQAYMNSARELLADTIAEYMQDPKLVKAVAPDPSTDAAHI